MTTRASVVAQIAAEPQPGTLLRRKRVAIVVGGALSHEKRRDVAQQRRARIDVLEMESRYGARLYDFNRLKGGEGASWRTRLLRWLARRTGLWSFCLAFDVLGQVRRRDLVYATGEDVGFPLAVIMRLFRVRRPRLLVRLEQPIYGRTGLRQLVYHLFARFALRRIDRVICRTTAHLQYLNSVVGVPMDSLCFAPESTDPTFYSPETASESLPPTVAPPVPFIVSAGLEMRDYATLVEAVRGQPVHLVIGAGSPWSHFRFDATREMPPNVNVSSFSPVQMRDLYRSAAFVVVPVKPTLRACGMNVVLEAWAMGKAVVATRTAGLLDYANDGEDVLFVRPGDVEDMRAKISHLLRHPEAAQRLGENGRRTVQTECNLDSYVALVEEALVSALGDQA